MGLPSGVKWGKKNLGALSEADYGLFFSWGNTGGHAADEGYLFDSTNYSGTPGRLIQEDLSLAEDAANTLLGAGWRMPTRAECEELVSNTTFVWTTRDGINGVLITSTINGQSIFLPASGNFTADGRRNEGARGYVWSSTFNSSSVSDSMYWTQNIVQPDGVSVRSDGIPIRPVFVG